VWDMPFSNKEFDFIISSGMMEHVPEDHLPKAISEIKRVGMRGLIGVAVTDDITTHQEDDPTHEKIKSLSEWKALLPPEFEVISDSEVSWRIYTTILAWKKLSGRY